MKLSAHALMKLHHTLSALVLSASAAIAQAPDAAQPVPPPATPAAAPGAAPIEPPAAVNPAVPAATPAPGAPLAPAPIEPPVQQPGAGLGTPGAVTPGSPAVLDAGAIAGGDPSVRRISEFSGDPIDVVLRTLARQANMSVIVSPTVQGTVNMRLVDKTPREVIEVIVQANGLFMDELNGV